VNGHGTAVAGAAAAAFNNGIGVASVAGAAKIMPLRVTDSGGYASGSAIAQALSWAADRGARVANVSISGVPNNPTIDTAASYMRGKGGLVIVAAGNTGADPGLAEDKLMTGVSATNSSDQIASWSSYGKFVSISAPGDYIWTTQRGGSYGQWWGTSLASPVTAGVVALMMSARPDLPNTQIESLLYASATDLGAAGRDIYYGYGRVNAAAAVAAARAAVVGDTEAPSASISAPGAGATVSGLVTVDVSASDNVGVARVELRVDGVTVASDYAGPYQFGWDSTQVADGAHALEARAYDGAGNVRSTGPLSVTVKNNATVADTTPPAVAITSPGDGATVGNSVTISVSSSDNAGPAGIRNTLFIDGVQVAGSSGGALTFKWSTRKYKSGSHTIQAVAVDAAGNRTSTYITVRK
jgi:subtilisin family serine protease